MDGDEGTSDAHTEEHPAERAVRVRPLPLLLLGIGVLAIPIGLIFVYLALTKGEPAPRPALSRGVVGIDSPIAASDLDGRWSLVPGSGSFVGYRIEETMLNLGKPNPVTGRSTSVEAGFVVRGGKVQAVLAQADLRQLRSDDPDRDTTLRTRGLATDTYPLARFWSDKPLDLPATISPGASMSITLDGQITLHGVTRPVSAILQAQVRRDDTRLVIELVGNAHVKLSDFGIEPPDVAKVLTVRDEGELELQLRFDQRAATVTIPRDITTGTTPDTTATP